MDVTSFSENPFFWLFVEGVGVIVWKLAEARFAYVVVYTVVVGILWFATSGWAKRHLWQRHHKTILADTATGGIGGRGGDAQATESGKAIGGRGGVGGPPGGRGGDGGDAEARDNATAIGGEGGGGDGHGGRSGIDKVTGWDLDMVLPDGRRLRDVGHGGDAAVLGGPGIGGKGGGAKSTPLQLIEDPIRAWIKVLTPQSWTNGPKGMQITFPVQIVNREAASLILTAKYELATDQGTYTAYLVSLDGRPQDGAVAAKPDEPLNTTAVITQFMSLPIPEQWQDRIKYPTKADTRFEHRLVFTDAKTNRTAVVTDKRDYDVS
jgi:hypothetical protein